MYYAVKTIEIPDLDVNKYRTKSKRPWTTEYLIFSTVRHVETIRNIFKIIKISRLHITSCRLRIAQVLKLAKVKQSHERFLVFR